MINGRHLVSICDDPDMPGRYNVYRWMNFLPDFATKITIAREMLGEHYAAKVLEAADKLKNKEDVSIFAARIRAWMWAASKYAPRQYSDRVIGQIHFAHPEARNGNSKPPVDLSHMTKDEKAELKRLLEKAKTPVGLVEGY